MKKIFLVFVLIFFCSVGFSSSALSIAHFADVNVLGAVKDANIVDVNKVVEPQIVINARLDIAAGEVTIKKIADANLPTGRISDLLLIAKNSLAESLGVATVNKTTPNLSGFKQRMNDFLTISQLEFSSHDELLALRERINRAAKDVKDLSSVETIYSNAQTEFNDERFERVMDLISSADSKIIDLTSIGTRAEVIYDAAATNIRTVITTYWKEISLAVLIPFIFIIIFRIKIKQIRLKAKIESLTLEKDVLLEEIKKAQSEYFVKGSIPDGVYTAKVNVFSGMIRDLTKEISLLKEQEEKINTKNALNNLTKKKQTRK